MLERLGFQDVAQHNFVHRFAEDMTRVQFSSDKSVMIGALIRTMLMPSQ